MVPRITTRTAIALIIVLLAALALKYHYSTASVDELRWALAPTVFLVETLTGIDFAFESQAGYMSADHTFLVAAVCSGVNFMIVAFLVLALGELWRERLRKIGWSFLPLAMLAAYLTTIAANTVRIVIALQMREIKMSFGLLDAEELHRIEGIVVYFGFLIILYVLAEALRGKADSVRLLRRLPLPLAIYYSLTLGVPLATGSFRSPDFAEHALYVFVTPLILIAPIVVACIARLKGIRAAAIQ